MNKDISVNIEGTIINIRSCGIICDDYKILVHKKEYDEFYALIGGRVKVNETTKEAVCREFKEELDIDINVINLLHIVENFYTYNGVKYHEFMFVYLVESSSKVDKINFKKNDNFFSWIHFNELSGKIKPDMFEDIQNLKPLSFKHTINKEI